MKKNLEIVFFSIFFIIFQTSCLVIGGNSTQTPLPTKTPIPKTTTTPSPTPNPLELVNGRLLFNIYSSNNTDERPKSIGAFIYDPQTNQLEQISHDEFRIEDVSIVSEKVLFANNHELYLMDLLENKKYKITDFLFDPEKWIYSDNAIFLDESNQVAFIGQESDNKSPRIFISDPLEEENKILFSNMDNPYYILGFRDNALYWMQAEKSGRSEPVYGDIYNHKGIIKTNINGGDMQLEINKLTYDFFLSNDGNFLIHSPAIGSHEGSLPPTIYIKNYLEDKELVFMSSEQNMDPDFEQISRDWKDNFQEWIRFSWSPKSNFFFLDFTVFEGAGLGKAILEIRKVYSKDGDPLFTIPHFDNISHSAFSIDEKHLVINLMTGQTLEFWDVDSGKNIYNLSIDYLGNDLLNLDYYRAYFGDIYFIP